jgi:peptide/nickel transport system substrate-binding protein
VKSRIIIARDSDLNDLDPHNFKSEASYEAVENLYDGLLDLEAQPDRQGNFIARRQDVIGEIVEAFELSERGSVVTLHIRRGIRFSNGASCTAHSIRFSLERALEGPGYLASLLELLTLTDIEQVTIKNDFTLVLQLSRPNPMLLDLLPLQSFSVMDPGVTRQHASPHDPWATAFYKTHAVGTGPYLLADAFPGEKYLFAPNPDYWRREEVFNDGIVMRIILETTERLKALSRGEVDLVVGIVPQQARIVLEQPGLRLLSFPTTVSKLIALNNQMPPLDDSRVRQALAYAVPYQALRQEVMAGYCQPLDSPVPAGMATHDGSLWEQRIDIRKARQLLAKVGCDKGFDLPLLARNLKADDCEVVRHLQESFAAVKVRLEPQFTDDATFFQVLEKGFPAILFETLSWVNDPFFHYFWHFRSGAPKNFAYYSNHYVDGLIASGLYEMDPGRREQISRQTQKAILADMPWLFLYQPHWLVAAADTLRGYAIYPDLLPRYRFLTKTVK